MLASEAHVSGGSTCDDDASFSARAKAMQAFMSSEGFKQVVRLHGTMPLRFVSAKFSEKLYNIMREHLMNGTCSHTFGALDSVQVVQFEVRCKMTSEERAKKPSVDYMNPIIADADTGHDGLTARVLRNVSKAFVSMDEDDKQQVVAFLVSTQSLRVQSAEWTDHRHPEIGM